MPLARERLAGLIDRVLAGDLSPDDALRACQDLPKEEWDTDTSQAWHLLVHYRDDEDLRSTDRAYAERQRRGLQRWASRLRVNPDKASPRWPRMLLIAVAVGIAVSVWIVRAGGPSERLTATWTFGFRALVIAVLAAEILTRLLRRRG